MAIGSGKNHFWTSLTRSAKIALVSLVVSTCNLPAVFGDVPAASAADEQAVTQAMARVAANPEDAKARYALGDAYKNVGRFRQAASEFLQATFQKPTFYMAYHQLTTVKPLPEQLDEAIGRLDTLKQEHPQELMLCVALSELLEQKGDYYQADRTLIDISYKYQINPKYVPKVNARIHYLLSKARKTDTDTAQKLDEEPKEGTDDATPPPPLPETTLHRDLRDTDKDRRAMQSFGHATLLP